MGTTANNLLNVASIDSGKLTEDNLQTPKETLSPEREALKVKLSQVSANTRQEISDAETTDARMGVLHGREVNVDMSEYDPYIDRPYSVIADDIDELRAQNQSGGEKWSNGAIKFVGKTGTNVLGSTVGLLYGGAEWLNGLADPDKSATKAFFDNDFQRGLDGVNEWMDGKLPNYYTKEEQNYNLFQSMGTANFWANDFTQGLSFVAGAVLAESLTAGLASGSVVAKATKLLKRPFKGKSHMKASGGATGIAEKAAATSKASNALTTLRQLGTGAMYESGVEARHHYDSVKGNLMELAKAELPEGAELSTKEMAEIEDIAVKSSNAVFAGNLALVGYSNYMMFPKIFGKGMNRARRSVDKRVIRELVDKKKMYKEALKDVSAGKNFRTHAWKIAKTPLYEGFGEEGGQKLLDLVGQGAAEDFYTSKANPEMMDMVTGMMGQVDDKFMEVYGSKEGQKEIGLGVILAAMGLPGVGRTKGKDGKSKKSLTWNGGAWDAHKEALEENKYVAARVKYLQENPHLIEKLKSAHAANVRAGTAESAKNYAESIDSAYLHANTEHDEITNWIVSRVESGFEDEIADEIASVREMSVQEFRDSFHYNEKHDGTDAEIEARREEIAVALEAKVENLKRVMRITDDTFLNWDKDQKLAAIHALSVADDSDIREDGLIAKVEKLMKRKLEVEVEDTSKAKKDAKEEEATKGRLKNLWHRMSPKSKKSISNSKEAKATMKRLGIKEFSDPTHLEELYRDLNIKAKVLEVQLEELQKQDEAGKDEVTESKARIIDALKETQARQKELAISINEGLDPHISANEQTLLDEWKAEDPTGFAENKSDVTSMMKDLRKIRARRHRAINMYNNLLQIREEGTWMKKGELRTPPQIRVQEMLNSAAKITEQLKTDDPLLAGLYDRHRGNVIEFEYTNKDGETSTYRVLVEDADNAKGSDNLLHKLPDNKVIKGTMELDALMKRKERTVKRIKNTTDVKTTDKYVGAKRELALLESQIEALTEILEDTPGYKKRDYSLNMLKEAKDIRTIEETVLVQEQVDLTIEMSEKSLKEAAESAVVSLDILEKDMIEAKALLESQKSKQTNKAVTWEGSTIIGNLAKSFETAKAKYEIAEAQVASIKRNMEALKGFKHNAKDFTSINQVETMIDTIYSDALGKNKNEAYNDLFATLNKSRVKKLITIDKDGKESLDLIELKRLGDIAWGGAEVGLELLTKFEPQAAQIKLSMDALEKEILALGNLITLNKPVKGQDFRKPRSAQKAANRQAAEDYNTKIWEHRAQAIEMSKIEEAFRREVKTLRHAFTQIKNLSVDLTNNLRAINAVIKSFANPKSSEVDESDYLDSTGVDPDTFEMSVERGGKLYHNRSGIVLHELRKTAGSYLESIKTINSIKNDPLHDVNQLAMAESAASFYALTSEENFNTAAYSTVDPKVDKRKYRILLLHRKSAIPTEIAEHLVFHNEGKFQKAGDNTSALHTNTNKEDIKAVIVDAEGKPVFSTDGHLLYTSIHTAEAFDTITDDRNQTFKKYRYGVTDLENVEKTTLNGKDIFTGELSAEADLALRGHNALRDGILMSPDPVVRNISGHSFAMVNKDLDENGDAIVHKPSATIGGNLQEVKLSIQKPGSGITIGNKTYSVANGQLMIDHNGKPVPVYGNVLSVSAQENILNILNLYALNKSKYENKTISQVQSKLIDVNDDLSPAVQTVLKQIVYFGDNTKTSDDAKKGKQFYIEKGTIYFGEFGKIDLHQLRNPAENADLIQNLKDFLATLHFNADARVLKMDHDIRKAKKSRGTWDSARKRYLNGLKSNKKRNEPLTKDYIDELMDTWDNKEENLRLKKGAVIENETYKEYRVDATLEVSSETWGNYTEYLLGDGAGSNKRATPQDIPLYTYLNTKVPRKNKGSHMTAQFLNTYLAFEKGNDVSKMQTLDELIEETAKKKKKADKDQADKDKADKDASGADANSGSTTALDALFPPAADAVDAMKDKTEKRMKNKIFYLKTTDTIYARYTYKNGKVEYFDMVPHSKDKEGKRKKIVEKYLNTTDPGKGMSNREVLAAGLEKGAAGYEIVDMPTKASSHVPSGKKNKRGKNKSGGSKVSKGYVNNNQSTTTKDDKKNCKPNGM